MFAAVRVRASLKTLFHGRHSSSFSRYCTLFVNLPVLILALPRHFQIFESLENEMAASVFLR